MRYNKEYVAFVFVYVCVLQYSQEDCAKLLYISVPLVRRYLSIARAHPEILIGTIQRLLEIARGGEAPCN